MLAQGCTPHRHTPSRRGRRWTSQLQCDWNGQIRIRERPMYTRGYVVRMHPSSRAQIRAHVWACFGRVWACVRVLANEAVLSVTALDTTDFQRQKQASHGHVSRQAVLLPMHCAPNRMDSTARPTTGGEARGGPVG